MSKSTRGTRTLTIGELRLKVMGVDLAAQEVDRAVARDFSVGVAYCYQPSIPDEGLLEWVRINAVRATANVHFDGESFSATAMRGADLLPLFSGAQIAALEDRILMGIRAGVGDE